MPVEPPLTSITAVATHLDVGRETPVAKILQRVAIELSADLAQYLRDGSPAIYPQGHLINIGLITIDPRPLPIDDARIIAGG